MINRNIEKASIEVLPLTVISISFMEYPNRSAARGTRCGKVFSKAYRMMTSDPRPTYKVTDLWFSHKVNHEKWDKQKGSIPEKKDIEDECLPTIP